MKVVTAEQMRRIDARTIEERGVPGLVLMERAGRAVARVALERFEPDSVAIVTGAGNNAGDGFIVARELHRQGVPVVLYLLRSPEALRGDALAAWRTVPAEVRQEVQPGAERLRAQLAQVDLIIDAILGTGLRGPVDAPWSEAIEAINAAQTNVLAIDLPSGLSAEPPRPGEAFGPCVQAMLTVTIGLPKLSLVLDPGLRMAGAVVVEDIDFPPDLLADEALTVNLLTVERMRALLPARSASGNKGTFGKVLILAGSEGMTGAAVLAARAAARSGAGLIYSAYPRALGPIMEAHLIEPVKLPLAGPQNWLTEDLVEKLPGLEQMDAVAIGPGLGLHPETGRFLTEIIKRTLAPLLIDADGLTLLAREGQMKDLLRQRPGPTVLTPHPGEAARLLGTSIDAVQGERLSAFESFCAECGVVTVLKGRQTVVTAPGGQRYVNPTGNSGLAKGGAGDVLTGLIAGLLAQGCAALDAACLCVFLHGLAADVTAERLGLRAMLPSDVIEDFGAAFQRLEREAS